MPKSLYLTRIIHKFWLLDWMITIHYSCANSDQLEFPPSNDKSEIALPPKFDRNRTHYKKRHQHRARRSSTELLSWRQSRLRRHQALTDRHLKSRCNCYRSHFLQSAPRLCSPQICQMWNEDLLWEERPFCFSSNLLNVNIKTLKMS